MNPRNAFSFLFIIILTSFSASADWQRTGPTAGSVKDIAPDRRNPSVWYVINATSTDIRLYRSTDSGESWRRTKVKDATSVVVSPANSDVYALGSYQNDGYPLWVSSDSGKTFALHSTHAPSRIFPHPKDPSILFGLPTNLAGYPTFSSDNGRTWVDLTSLPYKPGRTYEISPYCKFDAYEFDDILISPFDGKTVYASGILWFRCGNSDYDEKAVTFRSGDLGRSWRVEEFVGHTYSYDPAFPNRAFTLTPDIRILTEKGWRFLSNQSAMSMTSIPARPDELYIYRTDSVFGAAQHYRSRDGGRTWSKVLLGPANGIRILAGRENPAGSLLAGTIGGGLYAIDDKGGYHAIEKGFQGAFLFSVAGGPPSSTLYVVSRGGVSDYDSYLYRSTNNGRTWHNITDRLPVKDAAAKGINGVSSNPVNAKHVLVQTGAGIAVSFDSGDHWKILHNRYLYGIFFHPNRPNEIYFTSYRKVYRSRDGGLSIQELPIKSPVNTFITNLAVDRDNNSIYLGTERGLYVSTDDGRTMHPIGPEQHQHCTDCWIGSIVQLAQQGRFLISTASGIYKTIDGGQIWHRISQLVAPGLYPTDRDAHHVFSLGDRFYESNDGGRTWNDISREVDPALKPGDLTFTGITNPLLLPWFISTRLGLYYSN